MHQFYKYQGAGNDFILFDNRNGFFRRDNHELVRKLCDRRMGIGADGLMLLQEHGDYDFEMIYYNADGKEGSMCGNGGRCIVAFAHRLGIISDQTDFLAVDGVHAAVLTAPVPSDFAQVADPNQLHVRLQMTDVNRVDQDGDGWVLHTGSPHYVLEVEQLPLYPVYSEGKKIRYHPRFERTGGINVNFIETNPHGGYAIRTYERGVEDETLACGTGATAAALAVATANKLEGEQHIPIKALGGDLLIHFNKRDQTFTDVYLEGPATFVFEGKINF